MGPSPAAGPPLPAPAWLPAEPSRLTRDLATFWAAARPGAPRVVVVTGAAAGLAGAVLLVGHRPGLGAALVALALWGAAVPGLWRRRHAGDLVLAGWSALLLAMVAVRDAPWVVALSVVVGLGVAAVALVAGRTSPGVLLAPVGAAAGVVRALPWAGRGLRALVGRRGRSLWVAARATATALLLVLVFGALFAAADPVFAAYLRRLPRLALDDLPGRLVVGLLVALLAAAAAQLATAPPPWSDVTAPPARPVRPVEWLVPIAALDLVVLAFLAVQAGALLRGHDYIQRTTGMSYAQYAQQGFGQLVAATALTLLVVGVAARRAPFATAADRLRARLGLGLLCVGTLGVVASALRRMALYVDTYGLTRLRLLSTWGEVAMGVVLVLVLVAGVRWRGGWLPRASVHVVAVAMLSLALVDPDALVVRYDARATGLQDGVDVGYLSGLSADAVPAVRSELDERTAACVLAAMDPEPVAGFADWNLARARAAAVPRPPAPC